MIFGYFPRLEQGHNTELFTLFTDQANFPGPYLLVDAKFPNYMLNLPPLIARLLRRQTISYPGIVIKSQAQFDSLLGNNPLDTALKFTNSPGG